MLQIPSDEESSSDDEEGDQDKDDADSEGQSVRSNLPINSNSKQAMAVSLVHIKGSNLQVFGRVMLFLLQGEESGTEKEVNEGDYDYEDDFIDDSEFADFVGGDRRKPKHGGFFINKVKTHTTRLRPCTAINQEVSVHAWSASMSQTPVYAKLSLTAVM